MWKFRFLGLLAIALLAVFLPERGSAQTPPAIVTRVISSGTPNYHFKIETYNNLTNWSQVGNVTPTKTENFFPIGWYITHNALNASSLQTLKDAGVNTVEANIGDIINRYAPGSPYTYTTLKNQILNYLSDIDTYGIKAVIDLGDFLEQENNVPGRDPSFTYANVADFVRHIRQSQYNRAVFAYYIVGEPETDREVNNIWYPISPQSITTMANTVRANDPDHLCYIDANPLFYTNPPYDPGAYDAFTAQLYNINNSSVEMNRVADYYHTAHGAYHCFDKIKNDKPSSNPASNRAGFIALGSGQDKSNYLGFRKMSPQEEMYQTLSMLIHGARGILYWWNEPATATTSLRDLTNQMIQFLTSKNNQKGVSIADVLMVGTDKTNTVQLGNITIDGFSSRSIHGSSVSFSNKTILKDKYTLFNFNKYEQGGSVYKYANNSWTENVTNLTEGCIDGDGGISGSWAPGRMVWDLASWNGSIFAAIQDCGQIWSAPTSTMNWSLSSPAWIGNCSGQTRKPTVSLGQLPYSTTLIAGSEGSEDPGEGAIWYTYNPSQNDACQRWLPQGNIIASDAIGQRQASTINCFTTIGATLYAGCMNGLYYSTNNGATWSTYLSGTPLLTTNVETAGTIAPYPILSLSPDNAGNLYVGSIGRVVMRSAAGIWTSFTHDNSSGLPNQPVYSLVSRANGTVFAGTGDGLYYYTGSSTPSWIAVAGLPTSTTVWDMAVDNNNNVYAATSKGVYKINTNSFSASAMNTGLPTASDLHIDYRTISIDANNNVYVGTRANGNSYANVKDRSSTMSLSFKDFPLFNYTIKKHEGSYYLFATNDFRPTVEATFVLDQVLDANETIYRVSELNIDGTETQLNLSGYSTEGLPQGQTKATFRTSFGAYQARVFRLDVIKWSNITSISRECGTIEPDFNPCATHAGGVTIADFDGDGQKDDFLIMWVPEMTGTRTEPFRFKVGWNITQNNGNINFDMTPSTVQTNFNGACYGELEGFSSNVNSGDVTNTNLGGWNYPATTANYMPDVLFMGVDPVSAKYRTRFLWDVHSSIDQQPISRLDYTPFDNNAPVTWGRFSMPAPTGATGSGIVTYYKTEAAPNSTRPEILLMHLPDDPQANFYRYSADWDHGHQYDPMGYIVPTIADARTTQTKLFTSGWATSGAAMAVGNLYPAASGPDKYKELVFAGLENSTQEIRLIVDNLDPATGESDNVWRPAITVPIRPTNNIILKDAGVSLGDIDGDGDDDIIIMAISQQCSEMGLPSPIYVRFGINTLINDPAKSFRKEAVAEQVQEAQLQQPTPGTPVHTTLGNQPNPFSTGTVVSYSIDKAARVEMEIYSMLGTVVHRVDAGIQQAGSYNLPFQAGVLPNGIYMCRLKVDGTVVNAVKMVLTR